MKFAEWLKSKVSKKEDEPTYTPSQTVGAGQLFHIDARQTIAEAREKLVKEEYERDCPECGGSGEVDGDDCPECGGAGVVDDGDWSGSGGAKKKSSKSKEDEKKFEVGDELVLIDDKKSTKMPDDAYEFLLAYKTFTVRAINDKGKINLGCRISKNENGKGVEKIYMFSTSRFELKDKDKKKAASAEAPIAPVIPPVIPTEPVAGEGNMGGGRQQ